MAIHLGNNKSYDRRRYVIPANSIYTVDFTYNSPNFYRLNNMSNVMLYCATASMPTDTLYDFKANPLAVANFTEPVQRDKLYILNQSNVDAPIILTSWADEFDPTFMAVSEITLNNEGTLKTDGSVKSFECELPPGNNNIGKVGLDAEALAKLDNNKLYEWCLNKLLSEHGHGMLEQYNEMLFKIKENTGNFKVNGLTGYAPTRIGQVNEAKSGWSFELVVDKPGQYIRNVKMKNNPGLEYDIDGVSFMQTLDLNEYLSTNKVEHITVYPVFEQGSTYTIDLTYEIYTTGEEEKTLYSLINEMFSATGNVSDFTGSEGKKSIFDLLYWIFENTKILQNELTTKSTMVGADYTVYELLEMIYNKVQNNSKNAVRIVDGRNNGYVMDECWVHCNDDEYIGEILNLSDKIQITTIRTKINGETDLQGFTIEEWNNICHVIKANQVSFIMKENDQNNRIFPYFAVYNY